MDYTALWEQACSLMREEMTEVTFNTWISSALKPIALKEDHLYIEAATDFFYRYVQPRYNDLITNALTQSAGHKVIAKLLPPAEAREFLSGTEELEKKTQQNPGVSQLNPRYTFSSFVVGNNNRFAHAASLAVAESPNEAFNPLFIYGGVGLGKTHLMHAIGHYILDERPDTRVCYMTAEAFTNEVINHIQNSKSASEFREKYRNFDVLMIDDIQFIGGKEKTQSEFFHTFNALRDTNKQIIITSDRPPQEIPNLEERLSSRFASGLLADISKPDLETRIAIMRRKANEIMLNVDDDVLQMIAERVNSNIRELEGCLTKLQLYATLAKKPVSPELAREALSDVFSRGEAARAMSCEDVMSAVAEYYDVTVDDLKSAKRQRTISVPRQVAMYLCREVAGASLITIGKAFNRDHSTVMHGCEKVEEEIKSSAQFKSLISNIEHKLTE